MPDSVTNFDFEKVYHDLDKPCPTCNKRIEEYHDTAASIRKIFQWVWLDRRSPELQRSARSAFVRMIALSALAMPEIFNSESYSKIAAKHGITRANISRIAVEFQDTYHVKFRRSRSKDSRDTYSQAQTGHQNYRTKGKWRE